MTDQKPDLRTNNGGKKGLTKFPNGFVRVGLKLRPEEKACFKGKNINDEVRSMIQEKYSVKLNP